MTPRLTPAGCVACLLAAAGFLSAAEPAGSKVIELSPFQVLSDKDVGYVANDTLAGSRLRTNLADVANAISVFTPEFIADLNAFGENDLMRYSAAAVPERTDQTDQVQGINTETGVFQYRIRGQLASDLPVPAEGSLLPDTYNFVNGESRQEIVTRMQDAMRETLAELWARRSKDTVARTPMEAVALASIVEKETGKPSERAMVAGLYSNRIRQGIMLQADPTIIYPITKGKPLGRRILQSEIQAINDYNTYSMLGLPKGPITNPGRESIAAVLNPAKTGALYMVADGSGGHAFAATLEEHNANVEKWFAIRRARGEM